MQEYDKEYDIEIRLKSTMPDEKKTGIENMLVALRQCIAIYNSSITLNVTYSNKLKSDTDIEVKTTLEGAEMMRVFLKSPHFKKEFGIQKKSLLMKIERHIAKAQAERDAYLQKQLNDQIQEANEIEFFENLNRLRMLAYLLPKLIFYILIFHLIISAIIGC